MDWRGDVHRPQRHVHARPASRGRHQVQLRALHGVYSQSLHVANRERLDWLVKPSSINSNLFFELAALKRVWLDQYDRIHFDYGGELVRWEQTQISVFMDVQSAPYGLPSGVVHTYWQELKRWEQYPRAATSS